MAVVIPLKLVYTPVDDTVTAIRNYQVPSTKERLGLEAWQPVDGLRRLMSCAMKASSDGWDEPGAALIAASIAQLASRSSRQTMRRWSPARRKPFFTTPTCHTRTACVYVCIYNSK